MKYWDNVKEIMFILIIQRFCKYYGSSESATTIYNKHASETYMYGNFKKHWIFLFIDITEIFYLSVHLI